MRGDDNQQKEYSATFPQKASSNRSPVAIDPQDGGRDSEGDVAENCEIVL